MKKLITLLLISFIILPFCVAQQVSAATPITVMGKVVDRHGNSVAGATVQLINDLSFGQNWNIVGTDTTDSNGNFDFHSVPSTSTLVKVIITFTENGKTYTNKDRITNDYQWQDASQGILQMPLSETTLTNYPAPEYGYLWGVLQQAGSNPRGLGNGVVYVMSGEQKYYTFTSDGSGSYRGTYTMKLPVGTYSVYAQYMENGILYQSSIITGVNVAGANAAADANPLTINMPMTAGANNPSPSEIPGTFINTVSGTVMFQDGSGVPGVTVSLWQSTDGGQNTFLKKTDTTADSNGFYQFNDVKVTSDPPSNEEFYGMKTYMVSASYTDSQGNTHIQNKTFPLYNPNVILGIGGSEQSARNMTADLQLDYSSKGWVKISCDPSGAKVYVDGQPLKDADGNQMTTPCTAYIADGAHRVKLSAPGYTDKEVPVNMVANQQTQDIYLSLTKPMVPGWVTLVVVVLILLIALGIILALVLSKRQMFMGPIAGILAPISKAFGDMRSSGAARKAQRDAQKARAAELKRSEQAHRAQMADSSMVSKPKLGRRREQESFGMSSQPQLPEHAEDRPSMVSAREIYRKSESPEIERIPNQQMTGNASRSQYFGGLDMPRREAPPARETPITAEPDGRIRIPRAMPAARDAQVSTVREKERVIKYIRDHQDGVSFIQMSNELEIPPNTLTIITKELVINDDIEKVKGLYYYKTHDSSQDEGKSSVVVWRLDGEE